MVKVTLDLSELEIEMLSHCIESAIDTKHIGEQDNKRAEEILNKLRKYVMSH